MTDETLTQDNPNVYNCVDEDLGKQLHALFQEGNEEVTVRHPVDGDLVVTRDDFYGRVNSLAKSMNPLSPAKALLERKRLERLKNYRQMQFRTKMIEARVFQVNLDGEDNYGYDAKGNKIGIEGLVFVPIVDYLDGIEILEKEIGAFVDYAGKRFPLRIVGT